MQNQNKRTFFGFFQETRPNCSKTLLSKLSAIRQQARGGTFIRWFASKNEWMQFVQTNQDKFECRPTGEIFPAWGIWAYNWKSGCLAYDLFCNELNRDLGPKLCLFAWRASIDYHGGCPAMVSAVAFTKEEAIKTIVDRLLLYWNEKDTIAPLPNTLSHEGPFVSPMWELIGQPNVDEEKEKATISDPSWPANWKKANWELVPGGPSMLQPTKESIDKFVNGLGEPQIFPISQGLVIMASALDG